MKHSMRITLILLILFLAAQITGLLIIDRYVDREKSALTGQVEYTQLPFGFERPDVAPSQSYIFILLGVLLGTGLFLLLVRFKRVSLWKMWFFFSVTVCMTFAFAAFISQNFALTLAIILALVKTFRPNVIVHNLTEVFVYGGLAAIFVPILNLPAAFILLILISIYDIFAVRKSEHMIKLAKFQTNSKVFAGLFFPGEQPKATAGRSQAKTVAEPQNAILGGGDIAFPLLFAGVVMKQASILQVMVIPICATVALAYLFFKAEKGKFYPAMPFLTAGCLGGYLIFSLLNGFF